MPSVKVAAAIAVTLILGFAGLVRGGRNAPAAAVAAKPGVPVALTDRLLFDLQLIWSPSLGALVETQVRANPGLHAKRLLEILDDERHPMLLEAMLLAAGMPLPAARPAIVRLAQSGVERLVRPALLAADRLRAWSPAELGDFLRQGRRDHILAALELAPRAISALLPDILPLLEHGDGRVRGAAVRAIPRQIEPTLRDHLITRARAGGPALAALVRALGRLTIDREIEHLLVDVLETGDRPARMAALESLAAKGSSLLVPSAVLAITGDPGRDLSERAAAFLCIERTRSVASRDNLPDPEVLHPYLHYFLARCLLTIGDRSGAGVLIGLLELDAARLEGLPPEQAGAVLADTRRLLALLAVTRPTAPMKAWKEWYAGLGAFWPARLDPMPFPL